MTGKEVTHTLDIARGLRYLIRGIMSRFPDVNNPEHKQCIKRESTALLIELKNAKKICDFKLSVEVSKPDSANYGKRVYVTRFEYRIKPGKPLMRSHVVL